MKRHLPSFLAAAILSAVLMFPAAAVARVRNPRRAQARTVRADNHPKVRVAISALEAARSEMKKNGSDFGGHKKDALESIDNALKQLRLALQFEKY